MENVLVATDLSPASGRALERGVLLSRQTGAHLHVVHVVPEFLPWSVHERRATRARERIREDFTVQPNGGLEHVTVDVVCGARANWIVRRAEDIDADLTIIGTSSSGKSRGLTRPIRRCVLSDGLGALLVVREDVRDYYRRILLATDNGTDVFNAAAAVRRIVPNASLRCVHTGPVPWGGRKEAARRICQVKRAEGADLVAVSVVRNESFLRVPFRSLAQALVVHAGCDTLVIPAA